MLELTGNGEGWTNHDTVVSGNHAYDAKDDDIELDGICVNARIFDNRFGNAENPISMAPGLPGPYFVLRNVISGDIQQAAIKMNTAGTPNSLIRNFYFYHNTIARSTQGTLLNLWYAVPGDHDVPIKNVVFRNNVFWAMAGGRATDVNNQGSEHPSFDYDLWYTSDTQNVFQWWNGSSTDKYDTFSEWQAGTGQETHGLFAEPGLDSDFVPTSSSPVVDAALVIDGVNDGFAGAAPDIGAYEVGDTPAGGTGGGGGGASRRRCRELRRQRWRGGGGRQLRGDEQRQRRRRMRLPQHAERKHGARLGASARGLGAAASLQRRPVLRPSFTVGVVEFLCTTMAMATVLVR